MTHLSIATQTSSASRCRRCARPIVPWLSEHEECARLAERARLAGLLADPPAPPVGSFDESEEIARIVHDEAESHPYMLLADGRHICTRCFAEQRVRRDDDGVHTSDCTFARARAVRTRHITSV